MAKQALNQPLTPEMSHEIKNKPIVQYVVPRQRRRSLIATQVVQPFSQRQCKTRLVQVHMISSLVYLPPISAFKLQKQVFDNFVRKCLNK
ncbi:hypothetical protein H5410_039254 [Solanum commersonii]|uniref:Uncharacterized protein n=1 Tax=Solanum commersonii TaxID=4109 RepID=A0A9J5YG79_SOLCO|nr:hypothetical protein H5410_039254 [Solanum commersonii]